MNPLTLLYFSKFWLFEAVKIFTRCFMAGRNCWTGFDWQGLWRVEDSRWGASSLLWCCYFMNRRNKMTPHFACHSSSPLPKYHFQSVFAQNWNKRTLLFYSTSNSFFNPSKSIMMIDLVQLWSYWMLAHELRLLYHANVSLERLQVMHCFSESSAES